MADEETLQEGQQPETEQQKKDKVTKKYNEAMVFVTALVGGEQNLRPKKKTKMDTTAKVVALLFANEQAALEQKAQDGLKDLLKKYVECQTEIENRKKELDKLDLQKKKEFTEAVNTLKNTIEQGDVLAAGYANALKVATEELAGKEK